MLRCKNPFFLREYGNMPCPCGQCLACRKNQARVWTLRLVLESRYYNSSCFTTLTYDPEHCPDDYNLRPVDLQLFFKRLRKRLDYKVKYFACGEYGDRFGRPHYHAIIFGLLPQDFCKIDEAWSLGNVKSVLATSETMAYTAGYVVKKVGFKNRDRVSEFIRVSKGIGSRFVDEMPFFSETINISNSSYWLGRFLTNKLAARFGMLESYKEQKLECLIDEWQEWYRSQGIFLSDARDVYRREVMPYIRTLEQKHKLLTKRSDDG